MFARKYLIRLASQNPELRASIIPLLRSSSRIARGESDKEYDQRIIKQYKDELASIGRLRKMDEKLLADAKKTLSPKEYRKLERDTKAAWKAADQMAKSLQEMIKILSA